MMYQKEKMVEPISEECEKIKFEVSINGNILNSVSYMEPSIISKEKILEIWNEVDKSVRNIITNGLYKDTTVSEAIINKKFTGW